MKENFVDNDNKSLNHFYNYHSINCQYNGYIDKSIKSNSFINAPYIYNHIGLIYDKIKNKTDFSKLTKEYFSYDIFKKYNPRINPNIITSEIYVKTFIPMFIKAYDAYFMTTYGFDDLQKKDISTFCSIFYKHPLITNKKYAN